MKKTDETIIIMCVFFGILISSLIYNFKDVLCRKKIVIFPLDNDAHQNDINDITSINIRNASNI
jgi:hypothetical protein